MDNQPKLNPKGQDLRFSIRGIAKPRAKHGKSQMMHTASTESMTITLLIFHKLKVDTLYSLGSTASRMKMSQFYTSQRTQFLKLQFTAKMRVSPLVTLGNDPRKRLLGGGTSSRVLRQLISKLKHSWKKTTGWHKRGPQFSYDFRSYCLNFSDDHGPSNDHIHTPFPPLA
ncbi:hypothetical protein DEO72_LG6g2485 [Vigna unguiculata]|uniref:Uncharacterized protein n=1 Tax=Vigna unguiculata TaxID=3917 RepID=A0A4D6M8P7_VIGUN|nr:hypothetical protein DEO72_LG6g2485 [Vigna unguiculata]